jgi:predicted enzyme related to lactoylglutathione lyase
MGHRIGWFDIPVTDLDRATEFYRQVLEIEIDRYGPDVPVAVMAHGPGDVSGCLALNEGFEPSDQGPLLYFTVEGRLGEAAGLVEGLGGRVVEPAHSIQPHGYRAVVLDSEGNRICLHSESFED